MRGCVCTVDFESFLRCLLQLFLLGSRSTGSAKVLRSRPLLTAITRGTVLQLASLLTQNTVHDVWTSQGNIGSQYRTQGYAKFGAADEEDEEGFKIGDESDDEGEEGGEVGVGALVIGGAGESSKSKADKGIFSPESTFH
ncbi:hypothetical protein EV421DRAFT_1731215 [Armillaria borealis]|uniref:Uncharacterized protein n=1 Tax=Armillaria borealis TaxID=47425 RepID=A0AA39MZN6_9AGAR|nr:hypothetical protein EV421DRAFT_1731215 [Armillaria borealis]